ncbi:MAG: sulfotransferase [Caldilineae bacterium]|nr:MAG: sulfotransferase [Caldilineae bacterium]
MLLLITGHNRSGTTLLQTVCNTHPHIGLTNEFGALMALHAPAGLHRRAMVRRWWQAQNRPFFTGASLWVDWCYHPETGRKQTGTPGCLAAKLTRIYMLQNAVFLSRYLRGLRRSGRPLADPVAVEAAYHAAFPRARIVGDNLPDYMFRLETLVAEDRLPCLVMYRDPRDVTADVLQRLRPAPAKGQQDLRRWWPAEMSAAETVARRWVQAVETIERFAGQIHAIRYEELVTQPGPVLERLGAWLGVDPSGFDGRLIRRGGGMGNYRRILSPEEVETVCRVAGTAMERLGYGEKDG